MTFPGPPELGRGVVVRAAATVPGPWREATTVAISDDVLSDPDRTAELIEHLHRAWVEREPLVIKWDLADDALSGSESIDDPPWTLEPGFLFPLERLRFLCFANNYDGRQGAPRWWWPHKAQHLGVVAGGAADGLLPDGTEVWIDGGPRQPLPALSAPVIHGESIEVGELDPVPVPASPSDTALADDQVGAVDHLAGPARIIAPAGSGKTRTLAARLRHLVGPRAVEPGLVTAVAYNARAAGELRDRLGADRATVRTIHSLGWAILQQARPGLELIDEAEIRNVLNRLVSVPRRANADPMGPYLEALDEVRAGLRSPQSVEAQRDDVPGFADAFDRYRESLYRRGHVDHGEQVYGAIEALLRDPALRAAWQRRCVHLLVDEFQDLTPAYLVLLRLVAAPRLQVFAVGDDDQVIYGYAGADPAYLIDFAHFFPGAGTHALVTNYRCPPAVVEAAIHVLGYNERRIPKAIRAGSSADTQLPGLEVQRHPGRLLASAAADVVEGWMSAGVHPSQIAVLSRVNATLIPVKAALAERTIASDDVLTAGSLRRTTLRALFSWVRAALSPDRITRGDALEAVRRPSRGLSRVGRELLSRRSYSLDEIAELVDRLDGKQAVRWDGFVSDLQLAAEAAEKGDAEHLLDVLIDRVGLGSSARTLDSGRTNASRSSHFDDLVAVRRAAALHPRLDDFATWLEASLERPPETGGVTLSTVHRVKGMEWPRVIVFGADRGAMPHDLAEDIEEERRVFHVALTRASEQSVVICDLDRPSRFVDELDGSAPHEPAPAPRRERRKAEPPQLALVAGDRVRVSGGYEGIVVSVDKVSVVVATDGGGEMAVVPGEVAAVLERAPGDQTLTGALKAWRLETSRRLGVPAFVVFNDKTLAEIVRRVPQSEDELLQIPGIGPRKLEDYGDEILGLISAS